MTDEQEAATEQQKKLAQTRALIRAATIRGLDIRIQVTGVSMFPYIWPREYVTFRPIKEGEVPPIGAILVVDRGEGTRLVAHRLIGWNGSTMIIRGDSNLAPDEPADMSNILGQVLTIEGRILHHVRHIPAGGGVFWKVLRALAPVSYWCNHLAVVVALGGWRVVRLFYKKKY